MSSDENYARAFGSASASKDRGNAAFQRGDFDEAIAAFTEAMDELETMRLSGSANKVELMATILVTGQAVTS